MITITIEFFVIALCQFFIFCSLIRLSQDIEQIEEALNNWGEESCQCKAKPIENSDGCVKNYDIRNGKFYQVGKEGKRETANITGTNH